MHLCQWRRGFEDRNNFVEARWMEMQRVTERGVDRTACARAATYVSTPACGETLGGVQELQPLFKRGLWIFGPEFETIEFTSNVGMTKVVQNCFTPLSRPARIDRTSPSYLTAASGCTRIRDSMTMEAR